MDTIHIIIAGCSFSDTGHTEYIIEPHSSKFKDDVYSPVSLSNPGSTLKYINYLVSELKYYNNKIIIHAIGKGSSGNHLIYNFYKNKVNELINSGIKPTNIYSTIQLSAISRPTHCIIDEYTKIDNYEYDYIDAFKNLGIDSYKLLIEKHIENIENIINFNLNNKIYNYKIFFGWATYFKDELIEMGLYDRLIKLKESNLILFQYSDKEDILNKTCSIPSKLISIFKNKKEIKVVKGDEFGGMAEISREYSNDEDYFYMAYTDAHLNGFGNYIFYKNFYRNFFIEWGLIENINKIEQDEKLWNRLLIYFKVQQFFFKESKTKNLHNIDDIREEYSNIAKDLFFKELIEEYIRNEKPTKSFI